jgi:hypothetical protein
MAVEKRNTKKKDETPQPKNEKVFEDSHEEIAEVAVKEEKSEMEDSIPMSMVERIMKEMEQKFTSQINKLKTSVAKKEIEEDRNYIEDLADDYIDNPIIFFAYSSNFSIHGDKKRGVSSTPPTGAVKFKTVIRTKRKGRKGTQVISVSSVKVHSKALAQWLENHSQFGISFFKSMDSAMTVDTTWAQKLVEANHSVQRLSDQQVIARCRQEGVAIGTDPDAMRKELVAHVAKKNKQRQDDIMYGHLRKANIENDREVMSSPNASRLAD